MTDSSRGLGEVRSASPAARVAAQRKSRVVTPRLAGRKFIIASTVDGASIPMKRWETPAAALKRPKTAASLTRLPALRFFSDLHHLIVAIAVLMLPCCYMGDWGT
jgi:hypothetical protein